MPSLQIYLAPKEDEVIKEKAKSKKISKVDYILELVKKDCENQRNK